MERDFVSCADHRHHGPRLAKNDNWVDNRRLTKGADVSANSIIFLVYLGFNGLILGSMIYKQSMTNRTTDWPSTPGKVKSSRVSFQSSTHRVNGVPWVVYSYEVNGKKYKGSVIVPGDVTLAGNDYAEKIVARYPASSDVTVYYNPNNPEDAFLERYSSLDAGEWTALIGGNVLITIGVVAYMALKPLLGR